MRFDPHWLSRSITRKFLVLLAGFVALQSVQLGTGIFGQLDLGEEGHQINDAGRQRVRTFLLGTLALQAAHAGTWEGDRRERLHEAIAASDRYFASTRAEPNVEVARARARTRATWHDELRPLLLAIDLPARPRESRAAAARYEAVALERLPDLERVVALLSRHTDEHAVALATIHGAVLAVSLILGVAGLAMARRVVTVPLRRLVEATQAVADGAYGRRVPVAGRDEVGVLAGTFNRMAGAIAEKTARLDAINETALAINSTLSLPDILGEIMRRGMALTGAAGACIAFHDERSGEFGDWVSAGLSDRFRSALAPRHGRLAQAAFEQSAACQGSDVPGAGFPLTPAMREEGVRCVICLPLASGEHRVGVIYFYATDRDTFWPGEVDVLTTFASLAAGAIANARLHAQTRDLAITDKLTGLRNRRLFDQHLADEVARGRRQVQPMGLLLLDIDHFKRVNDVHGHATGDQVLRALGGLVAGEMRESDLAARFGGEEFAIILPSTDGPGAAHVAERLRQRLCEQPLRLDDGRTLPVTLSIGVAEFPADGDTPARLVERADQALYAAKREGRNRVRRYRETLKARLDDNPAQVVDLLREGLHNIEPVITALSAKAGFFRQHSEAVERAAATLGTALRLDRAQGEALCHAARLHDVGMLFVPDEILGKSGRPSPEDWLLIRAHAAMGAELLDRVPALRHIAPVVRSHHERYDGSGFPDGLAGEKIPYLARALAVADFYGEVVGGWVGRVPDSPSRAIELMAVQAGTRLDPAMVTAFVDMLADAGPRPTGPLPAGDGGPSRPAPAARPGRPSLHAA